MTVGSISVSTRPGTMASFFELTKFRIAAMITLTAAIAFWVASPRVFDARFWGVVLGTGGLAAGASVLNQWWERAADALMKRTQRRPLPAGHLEADAALSFGITLALAGCALLVALTNLLAAALGVATLLLYVLAYTPLKRRSPLATHVGAIPGAMPVLIGFAAAGDLSPAAWALFAFLAFWQLPHFFAIAWLYRDDYRAGGFRLLPVGDAGGRRLGVESVVFVVLTVVCSLLPPLWRIGGTLYGVSSMVLGVVFFLVVLRFVREKNEVTARGAMIASVVYMPLILASLALGAAR